MMRVRPAHLGRGGAATACGMSLPGRCEGAEESLRFWSCNLHNPITGYPGHCNSVPDDSVTGSHHVCQTIKALTLCFQGLPVSKIGSFSALAFSLSSVPLRPTRLHSIQAATPGPELYPRLYTQENEHPIFRDHIARHAYHSVDELETHLNRVSGPPADRLGLTTFLLIDPYLTRLGRLSIAKTHRASSLRES